MENQTVLRLVPTQGNRRRRHPHLHHDAAQGGKEVQVPPLEADGPASKVETTTTNVLRNRVTKELNEKIY